MKANIYEILFWILFAVAIILSLWYLFGNSPTIEQALLVMIITFLFKFQSDMIKNSKEISILKNSFLNLVKDFKEHIKHG